MVTMLLMSQVPQGGEQGSEGDTSGRNSGNYSYSFSFHNGCVFHVRINKFGNMHDTVCYSRWF